MEKNNHPLAKPKTVEIIEKRRETNRVCSFKFNVPDIMPKAGQFFMIWVPGVDEIPMSISSIDNNSSNYEITVATVGDATRALCDKEPGEKIGIRGPFGNGFTVHEPFTNVCIIGGGVGIACVYPLVEKFKKENQDFIVLNAAKTKIDLVFHNNFLQILEEGKTYFTSTDDGTCGERCFGHELLLNTIESGITFNKVFACGPELMLKRVQLACKANGIALEASLERMMRCGTGLCGLCGIDPGGKLVCKDGPVFTGEELDSLNEFGKYHRDFSGKKIKF